MPATVAGPGGLLHGRWAGTLGQDPVATGPRRGRTRRWYYAAAGDQDVAVGAAVVVLGPVAVAFVWGQHGRRTVTWERRLPLRRGAWVARTPEGGAGYVGDDARVVIGGDGALELSVPTQEGRLRARTTVTADVTPVVLVTPTPARGWNATQKAAGTAVTGTIWFPAAARRDLREDAGGWRDWTSGRQDRTTTWRWAAGAGHSRDGRRVGLNVSTGMNGRAEGEDVVWWDGRPVPLDVHTLRPVSESDTAGDWSVAGGGWQLRMAAAGVRAEDQRLPLVVSRYVQPIGRFTGTLPDPDGTPVEVALTGVTEDHLAIW